MPSRYIRLVDLCQQWSDETGELTDIILSRLIGWANAGEFPEDSFFRPDGRAVAPEDLFNAWSSVEETTLESLVVWPTGIAKGLIREVLVRKDAVRFFCDAHSLRPPATVTPASRRHRLAELVVHGDVRRFEYVPMLNIESGNPSHWQR